MLHARWPDHRDLELADLPSPIVACADGAVAVAAQIDLQCGYCRCIDCPFPVYHQMLCYYSVVTFFYASLDSVRFLRCCCRWMSLLLYFSNSICSHKISRRRFAQSQQISHNRFEFWTPNENLTNCYTTHQIQSIPIKYLF